MASVNPVSKKTETHQPGFGKPYSQLRLGCTISDDRGGRRRLLQTDQLAYHACQKVSKVNVAIMCNEHL